MRARVGMRYCNEREDWCDEKRVRDLDEAAGKGAHVGPVLAAMKE